jgi:hypothetical protein
VDLPTYQIIQKSEKHTRYIWYHVVVWRCGRIQQQMLQEQLIPAAEVQGWEGLLVEQVRGKGA